MSNGSTKKDAEHLAETLLPGWKAVATVSLDEEASPMSDKKARRTKHVDSTMPSLEALKAKYIGNAASADEPVARPARDSRRDSDEDTAIVKMENGPLRKTIAVSKSTRKLLWSQG